MIPTGYHHRRRNLKVKIEAPSAALTKAKAIRKALADLRVVTPADNDQAQEIVCKMRIYAEEVIRKLQEAK